MRRARTRGAPPLLRAGLFLALLASAAAFPCPPVGFDSVHNLELAKYTTGEWYAQLQVSHRVGSEGGDGLADSAIAQLR